MHWSFRVVVCAIAGSIEEYGPGGNIMSVMIVAIAAFLIWYTKFAGKRGWLT